MKKNNKRTYFVRFKSNAVDMTIQVNNADSKAWAELAAFEEMSRAMFAVTTSTKPTKNAHVIKTVGYSR